MHHQQVCLGHGRTKAQQSLKQRYPPSRKHGQGALCLPCATQNSSGILDGAHPHTEIVRGMVEEAQNKRTAIGTMHFYSR